MALNDTQTQVPGPGMGRRGVLRGFGAGAASTAAAGTLAAGSLVLGSSPAQASPFTDADLITLFQNFEYLGAEYYLRGLTGQGLPASLTIGTGTKGAVYAGGPVPFQSTAIAQYVQRLAVDEMAHLQFFRTLLGSAAVAEPTVDISSAWTTFAVAAGLIAPGQTFDPYTSDVAFLLGAYIIEDVCVTAAAGAARYFTNKDNVEAAAGILGVEGYHAGAIRTLLANLGEGQATDAISTLRAKLSGAEDDQGTSITGQAYNVANTDSNALVFRRTPAQALNILYAGNPAGGGFFPNRLNGTIR
jgi:hypothetical protein